MAELTPEQSDLQPQATKILREECPECHAKFEYDDRMESVFVDTEDMRLPAHGTVCHQCGLVQGADVQRCLYCGKGLSGTVQ